MTHKRKQAAEWLITLEDPDISSMHLLLWKAWMKQSARNRRAFQEIDQVSRRLKYYLDELRDIPIPSRQEQAADQSDARKTVLKRLSLSPANRTDRAWEQVTLWPGWLRGGAVTVAAIVFVGTVYLLVSGVLQQQAIEPMRSYQTTIAEHRSIVLPDQTAISMGAKSSLSVNFSPEHRVVVLESGEALFKVAKDENRPFIVMAGAGTITARGTVFNVRRDGNRVVVIVTEGRVEVTRGLQLSQSSNRDWSAALQPTATTLSAGYQAVISPTELNVVELKDPAAAIDWQAGQLQFRAEPLKYVLAGVSRYSAKEIIIADKDVENILFTGSVFQDQTDEWLQALETVCAVFGLNSPLKSST